jgi:hypothetical protein
LESRNKSKKQQSKKKVKHGYTKDQQNMICSESSAYLPPSLGFWPKWRSIPALVVVPGWWVIMGVIYPGSHEDEADGA